jgi:hypothetical protein
MESSVKKIWKEKPLRDLTTLESGIWIMLSKKEYEVLHNVLKILYQIMGVTRSRDS